MLDLRFDQLRDRFGWMLGALVIAGAVVALIVAYRAGRPPRVVTLSALTMTLILGGLLFVPTAPRLIRALRQFTTASPPTGPSGLLLVKTVSVSLPPAMGEGSPIIAQIWYPSAGDGAASASDLALNNAAAIDCAAVLRDAHLSAAERSYPILLSAQSGSGLSDDKASTSAELASHGYVVLAVDDADYESRPFSSHGGDEAPPRWSFDFSSADAFKATLRNADLKVRRLAEKTLAALDRLDACANGEWREKLRFDQVGFFGFSIAGATAAEAGVLDPRVAAVANLDGWLFGRAATGALDKPYLILNSDTPLPGPRQLQSPDLNVQYEATLTDRDWREEVRLMNRPDGYGYWIYGAAHINFSDGVFDRDSYKYWLLADPFRIKSIADAYLLAFFDKYLRNVNSPLLRQTPSPYKEVAVLHGNAHWLDGETRRTLRSLLGW